MNVPRQAPGLRRVVIDEQQEPGGPLSYAVGLYDSRAYLRTTRVHTDHEAAAREAFDWLDWSRRRPVDTTPIRSSNNEA